MGCNYNSFSINATVIGGVETPDDVQKIQLFEGDELQSLRIEVKEWTCKDVDGDLVELSEWDNFKLTQLNRLTFYFGEIGVEDILFQGDCFISDQRGGKAYFSFPLGSLDGLDGDYIGYIKAFFENGRTVTVENKILFNVLPSHEFLT